MMLMGACGMFNPLTHHVLHILFDSIGFHARLLRAIAGLWSHMSGSSNLSPKLCIFSPDVEHRASGAG